jgi:hypothetical protein
MSLSISFRFIAYSSMLVLGRVVLFPLIAFAPEAMNTNTEIKMTPGTPLRAFCSYGVCILEFGTKAIQEQTLTKQAKT